MGNRQAILFFILGILVCSVLLLKRDIVLGWSSAGGVKESDRLVTRPLDTVRQLMLERGNLYAGLRRPEVDGPWELFSPFPARLDQAVVSRLLDGVENARIVERIRSSEMRRRELSLRDFGFAPAAVCITLQEGEKSDTIFVGSPIPSVNEVYVRVAAIPDQVMSVSDSILESIPKELDDLRSRDMVACERSRLRILEIKAPGKPFIRLVKELDTWRLTQPSDAPADDRKVSKMLDALYAAKVSRFVWPSATRPEEATVSDSALKTRLELYGLSSDMILQISAQESALDEPSRLVLGNGVEGVEGFRYALLPGGQTIATVTNAILSAFQTTPADLRDMRLFFETPDKVSRLEISVEGSLFVLMRQGGSWEMVSPIVGRADQGAVTEMIEQLLRLNALELFSTTNTVQASNSSVGEATDGKSRVDLGTMDGKNTKLLFAPEYVEGKAYYSVSISGRTMTYRVDAHSVPAGVLQASATLSLYDRTIFAFTNSTIQRISSKLPSGKLETVFRDKEGTWRLEQSSGVLAVDGLTQRLALLSTLTAERIEKPCALESDVAAYGLKEPWMEVSVSVNAGDSIRKTLLVGSETSGGARYAMVRGQDLVFVLEAKAVALLSKSLAVTL
jgi:Domain of unknown function (DUF4340)